MASRQAAAAGEEEGAVVLLPLGEAKQVRAARLMASTFPASSSRISPSSMQSRIRPTLSRSA